MSLPEPRPARARRPRRRRLRRLLRGRPRALRRRPAPVQARPDGAPHPHVRRRAAAPTDLRRLPRVLQARPRRARRVPRPRDDQRLAALAQPRAVDARSQRTILPELAAARPRARVERRLLLRRRGLHARRRLPRGDPARARRRSTAPTSTAAWSPAPATGASPPTTPAARRRAALERWFAERARRLRGEPRAQATRVASRSATCCACRSRASAYDLVLCRNTVIYFTEEVRDALHARLVERPAPRRLPRRRRTERVADAARARPRPHPLPSSTARAELMDISEYLPMFLAEAREHLQELNLAVVRIEEQPDDRETVDEIFRIAHSHEGHERDDGLRRHGGAHARDGGRLRAAAPARAAASAARPIDVLLRVPRRAVEARRRDRGRRRRAASTPSR